MCALGEKLHTDIHTQLTRDIGDLWQWAGARQLELSAHERRSRSPLELIQDLLFKACVRC